MADLKVTKMVLKVDLQCSKCYRKIKKVLCLYPREHPLDDIRDQVYDDKLNTVTITVVCCSPEKIKEKITCKAGDTVKSIDIVPDKPKELPKTEKPKVVFIEPPKVSAKPPAPAPAPAPAPKAPAPAPPPKTPVPSPIPPPSLPVPVPVVQVLPQPPPPGPVPIYP